MKCRGGGFQRCVERHRRPMPRRAELHNIHLDVGNIDPNAIAFRNDPGRPGLSTTARSLLKVERRAPRGSSGTSQKIEQSRLRPWGRPVATR
jgi:hypothetical protein